MVRRESLVFLEGSIRPSQPFLEPTLTATRKKNTFVESSVDKNAA